MTALPIVDKLDDLKQLLAASNCCLLQAEPGAGKTTRVPLALLDQSWLKDQKIIMLEPRRIAARSAARFMAKQLSEPVGQTVGYRLRLDTKVSQQTRIEVVTEGILTRMLQQDPMLEGIGCVIFDEFHERSLQADLGLAIALESQQVFREDLRLLVMSATLDLQAMQKVLGQEVSLLQCHGRSYPVTTQHLGGSGTRLVDQAVVFAVERALRESDGSLLVFLPGRGEISRVEQLLKNQLFDDNLDIIPLYGALTPEQQDRAVRPAPSKKRKIVLATDIAESSLTIDGISVVIDAGLSRKPRFDPRSGMSKLLTRRISLASAEQRRGRAGRLQAGHCYRLWSESQESGFEAQSPAEIVNADLAPLALELAQWGSHEDELQWIDPPPPAHLQQARDLLMQLQALDKNNRITEDGRKMAGLGTHPRLAHLMLKAKQLGQGALGCDLAALLGEKDLLAANGSQVADISLRLDQLHSGTKSPLVRRVRETSKRWQRQLGVPSSRSDRSQVGVLLAFAFPDRIAQRRRTESKSYRLRNGRGAVFRGQDSLSRHPYLVIADLDGKQADAQIYLAAELSIDQLMQHFSDQIEEETDIAWQSSSASVKAQKRECLGALVLKETLISNPDPEQVTAALLEGVRSKGLGSLPWDKQSRAFCDRVRLVNRLLNETDWPDFSPTALTDSLEDWLAPYLTGMTKFEQLKKLKLVDLLSNLLSWEQQQQLQEWLPSHFQVPSGSRIAIDYSSADEPKLSVRIQELFGLQQTPTLLKGTLPLTIELLSPAQRPIQITRDLVSFWDNTYSEVCKDLKGRYPKHYWPDNPYQAQATRGTKKQMDRNRQ